MIIDDAARKLKHEFEKEEHMLTTREMFKDIEKWLKENLSDEVKPVYDILDYASPADNQLLQDEYWPEIKALVNTGGSEGIYIDYYYYLGEDENRKRIDIATFKTLEEGIDAYGMMGKLAGYLTISGETYIALNSENIMKLE